MSVKFHPLYDRVLIERLEEKTSAGGIVIPDSAKEKPSRGKIIAVGKGKLAKDGTLHALCVKHGDIVIFGKYSGTEIKIDGKEYIVIREDDILGIEA